MHMLCTCCHWDVVICECEITIEELSAGYDTLANLNNASEITYSEYDAMLFSLQRRASKSPALNAA
jgi:hypothetical protein